jgi:hypothetical protein
MFIDLPSGTILLQMIGRLGSVIVLFFIPVVAQQRNNASAPNEPKLPVVDYNACPFEGCTFGKWKVTKDSIIYSSWEDNRKKIGNLRSGQEVAGITGVHITRQPDRIRVKMAIADLDVQPGDVILRYMYHGEGFADIWVRGRWHKEYDCSFVTEADGAGCLRECGAEVIENGQKEWWVNIKLSDGSSGWVLVDDNFDGMDALASLSAPFLMRGAPWTGSGLR